MNSSNNYDNFEISENDSGRRVDRVVRKFLKEKSLSEIYSSIRKGRIKLNGQKIKSGTKTKIGDILSIMKVKSDTENRKTAKNERNPETSAAKNIAELEIKLPEIDVVLKTADLLFINKRRGQTSHGKKSLDEWVKKYFAAKTSSLSFNVGALHRLDKDTSGLLAFSQSLKGARLFSKALQEGKIERYYIGINEGKTEKDKWVSYSPDKKDEKLITLILPIAYSKHKNLSINMFKLLTGKKHQIRKHSSIFGFPLAGDLRYGSKIKADKSDSYFLHAYKLTFPPELIDGLPVQICAELPKDFQDMIIRNFGYLPGKKDFHVLSNGL